MIILFYIILFHFFLRSKSGGVNSSLKWIILVGSILAIAVVCAVVLGLIPVYLSKIFTLFLYINSSY